MDRRGFFRIGMEKLSRTVMREMDARVEQGAARWIRPPYALNELEFLLACTRCDDCRDACPHGVIFALPARYGPGVAGTPVLDLLHKACHLCAGWPCVAACTPRALELPAAAGDGGPAPPRIARISVNPAVCLPFSGPECGACANSCPIPGALCWNDGKPAIDPDRCTGCGLCRDACIAEPKALEVRSLYLAPAAATEDAG